VATLITAICHQIRMYLCTLGSIRFDPPFPDHTGQDSQDEKP